MAATTRSTLSVLIYIQHKRGTCPIKYTTQNWGIAELRGKGLPGQWQWVIMKGCVTVSLSALMYIFYHTMANNLFVGATVTTRTKHNAR